MKKKTIVFKKSVGENPTELVKDGKPVMLAVATAHLDTQWRWTIKDTIDRLLPNTLRENFALFEKFPDYIFSFEGAVRYLFIKEYYPNDYEILKRHIAQGRWQVCGSWLDAVDVNISSPESLIRHALYGNGFFEKEFGKTSLDIFLPDCFGFGYSLPSIAAHTGIKGFTTQKLEWGSSAGIPFDIGVWEGVDGSKILAVINPGPYNAKIDHDLSIDDNCIDTVKKMKKKSGISIGYKYYGVGDVGGAPDIKSVEWIDVASKNPKGKIDVIFAGADEIYRILDSGQTKKFPSFNGEFLLTRHGTGSYTSQCAMKRWNRQNESLAFASEGAAVIAEYLNASKYPSQKIKDAWLGFLQRQFHDDLTGTSIPEVYRFSWNDEIISLNRFAAVLENAVGSVAGNLDTRVDGKPIIIFNPLSIERKEPVSIDIPSKDICGAGVKVIDKNGSEIPSQMLFNDDENCRLTFTAKIPSLGFEVYCLVKTDVPAKYFSSISINENRLENEVYIVKIDKNGDVCSIFDKRLRREILSSPVRLAMFPNKSHIWPAWEIYYETLEQKNIDYVSAPAEISVLESGPVKGSLKIVRFAKGSKFEQIITLHSGDIAGRIDFENNIDWKTKETLLKAVFPFTAKNETASYDLGVGTIERGCNTKKLYEVPAQQWADITDSSGDFGVSVLNDCKYGWDKPTKNILRLTLIHTPETGGNCPDQSVMDIGRHKVIYSIFSHEKDWRKGETSYQAARLNQPMTCFTALSHKGALGKEFSFLKITSPQIMLKAIKKAEDSDEIIIRLQELYGKPAKNIKVTFAGRIVSAREVNGVEKNIRKIPVSKDSINLDFEPYKPVAIAVKLAQSAIVSKPPKSRPIILPYNINAVSFDTDEQRPDFDSRGFSIPAELFPSKIVSDDVKFQFGKTKRGNKNALACDGQKIPLPSQRYSKLYILACSTGGTAEVEFKIDGKVKKLTVEDYNDNIGQWNHLIVNDKFTTDISQLQPIYIKRDNIAWIATHLHKKSGGNESYSFCYLFKYKIDLPKNAAELTLPKNQKIKIFAATLSDNKNDDATPAQYLYDAAWDLPVIIKTNTPKFIDSTEIALSCSYDSCEIRFTLDGSEPTEASPLYKSPIIIDKQSTLKAKAFVSGKKNNFTSSMIFYKVVPKKGIDVKNLKSGIRFSYFEKELIMLPDFESLKPIKTGISADIDIAERMRDDNYALRFVGYIKIEENDIYTFYTKSDDGSRIIVSGEVVVNNDGLHGAEIRTGDIALSKGIHKFEIQYFQAGGDQSLEIGYWTSKSGAQKIAPADLFYKG